MLIPFWEPTVRRLLVEMEPNKLLKLSQALSRGVEEWCHRHIPNYESRFVNRRQVEYLVNYEIVYRMCSAPGSQWEISGDTPERYPIERTN